VAELLPRRQLDVDGSASNSSQQWFGFGRDMNSTAGGQSYPLVGGDTSQQLFRRDITPTPVQPNPVVGHAAPALGRSLRTYGRDMTATASQADPVVGRDDEIDRVLSILCRRTKNCVALVGDPGVGKTAIAEGLAQRVAAGTVPPPLIGTRVVELDVAGMVAGTQWRGMFEERMKNVLKEAEDANGQVIFFIDEMHMLIGRRRWPVAVSAAWVRPR
jgi:ATP-dependent Clp protease ATP-binding subunit ClpA